VGHDCPRDDRPARRKARSLAPLGGLGGGARPVHCPRKPGTGGKFDGGGSRAKHFPLSRPTLPATGRKAGRGAYEVRPKGKKRRVTTA